MPSWMVPEESVDVPMGPSQEENTVEASDPCENNQNSSEGNEIGQEVACGSLGGNDEEIPCQELGQNLTDKNDQNSRGGNGGSDNVQSRDTNIGEEEHGGSIDGQGEDEGILVFATESRDSDITREGLLGGPEYGKNKTGEEECHLGSEDLDKSNESIPSEEVDGDNIDREVVFPVKPPPSFTQEIQYQKTYGPVIDTSSQNSRVIVNSYLIPMYASKFNALYDANTSWNNNNKNKVDMSTPSPGMYTALDKWLSLCNRPEIKTLVTHGVTVQNIQYKRFVVYYVPDTRNNEKLDISDEIQKCVLERFSSENRNIRNVWANKNPSTPPVEVLSVCTSGKN